MAAALLRVTVESGETWDDPSEDLLFELLSDLENGGEQFLIVERLEDASGQTYVQVVSDDGVYRVEYRDGGADTHFAASTQDKFLVHSVITRWSFKLPGWRVALPWRRLDLSLDVGPDPHALKQVVAAIEAINEERKGKPRRQTEG